MSVVLVIDADAVIARMGLANQPDVVASIESALPAAHLTFQGLLDSKFEPVVGKVDEFWLEEGVFPVVRNGYYRCRLARMFVKSTPAVVVEAKEAADGTYAAITAFRVDYEKGILHVSDLYAGQYIRATYNAGFDSTNKAPDWLKEAMLAYMPSVLNSQQTTNRSGESEPMFKQNTKLASIMLEPNMRGTAFQYRPV